MGKRQNKIKSVGICVKFLTTSQTLFMSGWSSLVHTLWSQSPSIIDSLTTLLSSMCTVTPLLSRSVGGNCSTDIFLPRVITDDCPLTATPTTDRNGVPCMPFIDGVSTCLVLLILATVIPVPDEKTDGCCCCCWWLLPYWATMLAPYFRNTWHILSSSAFIFITLRSRNISDNTASSSLSSASSCSPLAFFPSSLKPKF